MTAGKLADSIIYVSENLDISFPKACLQSIKKEGQYLRYLEIISGKILDNGMTTWLAPFKEINKYFNDSEKWYTFLDHLYKKFSEYNIQKDRERYNVADLDDWGEVGKIQGISVTSYNVDIFLEKIKDYNLPEYQTVRNITATGLQMEELNQVLTLTLKHRPTIRCLGPHIIVKDNFVILNEMMRILKSDSDTNNNCTNYEHQLENGKYDSFKIFASNKVFIDTDLSFSGKGISVAIIAPKWEVIGSRFIDVSGAAARPHWERKAKDGPHPGSDGTDGAPGQPGMSGESFFGVGEDFADGNGLQIISNGGKGGRGQDGGDGHSGIDGKDAPILAGTDPYCTSKYGKLTVKGFECEYIDKENILLGRILYLRIFGERGGKGGNGGDGGKGGMGGNPGNILIVELSKPSNIIRVASIGGKGDIGKAGVGKEGGKDGKNRLGTITEKYSFVDFKVYEYWWTMTGIEIRSTKGAEGIIGTDGKNSKNIEDPIPAKGIARIPSIINDYKYYLRENMNNRVQKLSITTFLDALNKKSYVRKLYDISALIEEFKDLEKQFPQLGQQIDFSSFYSSLLERIYAYAKDEKKIQVDNKKVLNYLYTATLGKINFLKKNSDKILIINMRAYLDMVEKNIETLNSLQTISNKVEVINKYKENYKKGIEKKIEEAQSLIEKQINPEMENINSEIDTHINSLIQETIRLEKQSEKRQEELAAKSKALQDAMGIKGIFSIFKIIGGVANLMGPYGQIAGTVINGITSIAEPFALKKEEEYLNIPTGIQKNLDTLKNNVDALRGKKIGYLEKLLENAKKEIVEIDNEELKELTEKIIDIENKVKKVKNKELDFKNIKELEEEFKSSIKTKGLELEKIKGDPKITDASKVINKLSKFAEFGSLFTEIYSEYKKDKKELDTVTKSMEIESKAITLLAQYEKSIYDTIAPMLQNMEDEIKDISSKLGTKSHVSLDVTKWQLQSSLNDMKMKMKKLTEGRKIQDNLIRCIEKLDEAMTILINVYDRMQSYKDQQNLANYIADISSVAATSINIQDQQLANEVNGLEYAIRGNLVLEQYKSAIESLKQWVFPFEDNYIEKSMLPHELEMAPDFENLVQEATKQVEAIRQKLRLYDTTIREGDQNLHCEVFNSRYHSTRPFYVWKNKENEKSISSLLSGNEVVLMADVKKSDPNKDALKFREVKFDLKMKNMTDQSILLETLKGFDIRATHLGNSYYKYKSEIFLIASDSVTISYSYEKDEEGKPVRYNEAYNKLISGDIVLSPYTLWEVKLINKTVESTFRDFDRYKNEIYIELSGLGCYVLVNGMALNKSSSFSIETDTMISLQKTGFQPNKSNHRSARSISGIELNGEYVTNAASKGISSPMDFLHNFMKTYVVSNFAMYFNHAFYGPWGNKHSTLPDEWTETTHHVPTVMSISSASEYNDNNEIMAGKPGTLFDVEFHKKNSFLLSNHVDGSNNHTIPVPDLNCSLLLADLVTRSINRNKYKSTTDECLLSPRQMIMRRLGNGFVQSEIDVKNLLHCHISESEVKTASPWLIKLKGYASWMLELMGLVGRDGIEEYVQDIRYLFA